MPPSGSPRPPEAAAACCSGLRPYGQGVSPPLRFGLQISEQDVREAAAVAQRAEEVGFDVVVVADHLGPEPSPLISLAAIARVTSDIRIGTLVLNDGMRNPVQLAWDVTTLDHLSGGRVELGLGAGHTPQEFAAAGIDLRPPSVRKQRLAESVEVIRRLLDGETVDFHGEHHRLQQAHVGRSRQEHLPILVGGNGRALLTHAGGHADIIGLQGLGRAMPDGHRHIVKWSADWLDTQIAQVRAGAGDRFDELELSALVQRVQITDDRDAALDAVCAAAEGLAREDAAHTPYLLIGTVEQIVAQIVASAKRWGITYYVVRELEAFAPVLSALRHHRDGPIG